MTEREIRVGMLGCGTVGSAVARTLDQHADDIARRAGVRVRIARVAVRDLDRDRNVPVPRESLTTDRVSIVDDADIDVVLELLGGLEPARQLVLRSDERWKREMSRARRGAIALLTLPSLRRYGYPVAVGRTR